VGSPDAYEDFYLQFAHAGAQAKAASEASFFSYIFDLSCIRPAALSGNLYAALL
jgi:hypothetical protein